MRVLEGSRQVRCVFVVIARWTLENDHTYEPVRHFFDAVFTYFLLGHCVRHRLCQFSRILLLLILLSFMLILNMEQNSTDVIIKTENLINAVQNEPSIWNIDLNSSEEEKELVWTRIAGVLQYSKSKRDARTSLRTC